jgi:hypothetical protein
MSVPRCTHGFLGRNPSPHPSQARYRFSEIAPANLPPAPSVIDWRGGVTPWGALANTRVGNCVIAEFLHAIMARIAVVTGIAPTFTDDQAIELYSRFGYDPATGANDNGVDIEAALENQKADPWLHYTILDWVAVDPTDPAEVRQALYRCGPLISGIVLQQSAEQQTSAGQPWTPAWFSPVIGLHGVPILACAESGVTYVSWGLEQAASWEFEQQKTDALYAPVCPEWFAASGVDPTGMTTPQLLSLLPELSHP